MTFDTKEHKETVLALINQASFPGAVLEVALELKRAALAAEIVAPAVAEAEPQP